MLGFWFVAHSSKLIGAASELFEYLASHFCSFVILYLTVHVSYIMMVSFFPLVGAIQLAFLL